MTSSGGMPSSIVSQPPISLSNISTNITSSYGTAAVSLGAQSSGTSYSTTTTHNLSPLPIRANQISTMPPLCQVLKICYSNQICFLCFYIWLFIFIISCYHYRFYFLHINRYRFLTPDFYTSVCLLLSYSLSIYVSTL